MTPKDFVNSYLPYARLTEQKTGINALAILTQAALESGWGKAAPGNMFFGVKDTDGINGNEQLIKTTEYHKNANVKYPLIISIEPVIRKGQKYFKYIVKDYFRKYNSPEESFTDHANFFFKNKRYSTALKVKDQPEEFLKEVARAGYATSPNYESILLAVLKTIQKNL